MNRMDQISFLCQKFSDILFLNTQGTIRIHRIQNVILCIVYMTLEKILCYNIIIMQYDGIVV